MDNQPKEDNKRRADYDRYIINTKLFRFSTELLGYKPENINREISESRYKIKSHLSPVERAFVNSIDAIHTYRKFTNNRVAPIPALNRYAKESLNAFVECFRLVISDIIRPVTETHSNKAIFGGLHFTVPTYWKDRIYKKGLSHNTINLQERNLYGRIKNGPYSKRMISIDVDMTPNSRLLEENKIYCHKAEILGLDGKGATEIAYGYVFKKDNITILSKNFRLGEKLMSEAIIKKSMEQF